MIVWATEIPIQNGRKADELLSLAKRWVTGSPHNDWQMIDFGNQEPEGEMVSYTKDGQLIQTAWVSSSDLKWVGFRYKWTENSERVWITEIVGYEKSDNLLASVRLNCELLSPSDKFPTPKKPYIVREILESLGGGFDDLFPVSDKPMYLREQQVDLAASLITGKTHNRLPIVYVSVTWNHEPFIDVKKLAQWTSGLAHVIVEPSRYFSFVLARESSHINAYGGAVSVHWPSGAGRQRRFLPEQFSSPAQMQSAIADCLRQAMMHLRSTPECTWNFLIEQAARYRVQILKDDGSTEISEFIEAFDAEITAKDERLEQSEHEIGRLRSELRAAAAVADANESGILIPGVEKPFYPGEFRDAVITGLENSKNQLLPDGRRCHIINDLLSVNKLSAHQERIEAEIKSVLNKANDLGNDQKKLLEELGFSIEDRKHTRLTYCDDERYVFTVSKTGSDWRAMKNLASEIVRKLFK